MEKPKMLYADPEIHKELKQLAKRYGMKLQGLTDLIFRQYLNQANNGQK